MRAMYCVVQKDNGWFVRLNGKEFKAKGSREQTIDGAICAATKAHTRGYRAHVMLIEGKVCETLWLNGSATTRLAA